ncbi:MAG TPA: prolyl oligopeptidase family serine peptidase [Opitutaceae bacterium]|nr:prolyl oligopeptidase family serine peptidase [Opitutaceae bacterium]
MSQTTKLLSRKITKTIRCGYLLHLPSDYQPRGKRWPLILFLHGAGERGSDLARVKTHGVAKIVESQPDFPFIVVSPQCPAGGWWSSETLAAVLDEVEATYRVDKNRVYVTGLSMGGFGTWQLAMDFPRRFAAIVPVCGRGLPLLAERIVHLPIWTFHGTKDDVVPIEYTREMVSALRKHGGKPKFTVYPGVKHDSWTRTYQNPRLYAWLLSHTLKKAVH